MTINPEYDRIVILFWFHLPLLLLHEFEEYVIPGGFKKFMNSNTLFSLDKPAEDIPLSEFIIAFINIK